MVTRLTDRQWQILRLIADGHTNAAIGRHLNTSEAAIGSAVTRLLAKFDARDRANLVHIAHQQRLLTHVECGTHNGYRRHQRASEPPCADCREAERIHSAQRRAQTRSAA